MVHLMSSPTERLQAAAAAYGARDWATAERLCRLILTEAPDCFEALNLLGIIQAQTLHLQEAAELLARALAPPRAVWIMVPAATVDSLIAQLRPLLGAGDVLIDGGNSNYRDDIRRADELKAAGIRYLDVGTSGGVLGLEQGFCLMIGGDSEAVALLEPALATLAPGGILWVCYPKAKALGTDLNRDVVRMSVARAGLETVAIVAVDDFWSALRCKPT